LPRRGRLELCGEVLENATRNPRLSATRVMASAGLPYALLAEIVKFGFVEVVRINKRNRRLLVTEKGREFLRAYRVCVSLFPDVRSMEGPPS
jgi:predicted transcriptional regulator